MKANYFGCIMLAAVSMVTLWGCESAGPGPAMAACEEAMALNAKQLRETEEGTQRLIEGCTQATFEHGASTWQCVVAEMKQGKKYMEATDKCFK
jgi:hypothetical protein